MTFFFLSFFLSLFLGTASRLSTKWTFLMATLRMTNSRTTTTFQTGVPDNARMPGAGRWHEAVKHSIKGQTDELSCQLPSRQRRSTAGSLLHQGRLQPRSRHHVQRLQPMDTLAPHVRAASGGKPFSSTCILFAQRHFQNLFYSNIRGG